MSQNVSDIIDEETPTPLEVIQTDIQIVSNELSDLSLVEFDLQTVNDMQALVARLNQLLAIAEKGLL